MVFFLKIKFRKNKHHYNLFELRTGLHARPDDHALAEGDSPLASQAVVARQGNGRGHDGLVLCGSIEFGQL
jgi:hypothetical protein